MLVVRCPVCDQEVMRARLVGYQHAPRLRKHLALHDRSAETLSSRDVLESFLVEHVASDKNGD